MAAGGVLNRLPFILRGMSDGLSGASILRGLRDSGLGVRTQDFYRMVGQARSFLESAPAVAELPAWGQLSQVAVERASRQPGSYMGSVALMVQDVETKAYETRWVTVATVEDLTRDETERTAVDAFEEDETSLSGYRVVGASLTGVWLGVQPG